MRILGVAVAVLAFLTPAFGDSPLEQDLKSVQIYRDGLRGIVNFAASRHDLFPAARPVAGHVLSREQKEAIWATWQPFLDYMLALDSIRNSNRYFFKRHGAERIQSFLAYYSAFLVQYRYAMEFFLIADKDPAMDVLLNEPVPEIGLTDDTYAMLKDRFLVDPAKGGSWGALESFYRALRIKEWAEIRKQIDEDSGFILQMAKGKGETIAAMAAAGMAKKLTFAAIFPVQSGVSEWMGDTKVYRTSRSLVTQDQIHAMLSKLQPGDIILERREWYLSNIGLPGFWPHAALYVGTPDERKIFFDDPKIREWLQSLGESDGSFETYLKLRYADSYRASTALYMKHVPRVLEAMSEGVTFTSLEHSAEADSVAVLRPRLDKVEKANAIVRAFHYAGRPYDFNFDFQTDATLVCTELIYKAYEPAQGIHGLKFPLVTILGRQATPANEMVRQFDEQFGSADQQTDFLLFLDGLEKQKRAVESTLSEFRQSWKRPKWHILVQ